MAFNTEITIPAGEFKAKCLHIMDIVNSSQQTIIITKYGKPVAKLVPIETYKNKKQRLFGKLTGSIQTNVDLTQSIEELWSADE